MNSQGITDQNARNGVEFNKHLLMSFFKQGSHRVRYAFKKTLLDTERRKKGVHKGGHGAAAAAAMQPGIQAAAGQSRGGGFEPY